jgi:hypothetical protein
MHIEVNNYSGHENTCEINYYDSKGDYLKSLVLDNLETELFINQQGNYAVRILGCNCIYYDDEIKLGVVYNLKNSQIQSIENSMCDCIDWETWQEENSIDIDDFINLD